MTFEQLLSDLRRKDIHLWVDGDRLRYKGPEAAVTESLLREIKQRKQEIIEYLEGVRDTHSAPTPIAIVARDPDGLPLSFAQQPLWFLEQLQPANTSNHLTSAFRIQGSLDKSALKRGIDTIVQRHEILRTTFRSVDGMPRQIVHPSLQPEMSDVDLQGTPDFDKERELQGQLTAEMQRHFDLADGPLLRVKLFHLADVEHVLLLTMHHIIGDGWSFSILCRELNALYEAFSSAKPLQLNDVRVQYGDYAAWHREQQPTWKSQILYWKEQLAGTLPILELPTDRPRPAVQTYRGRRHFFAVPAETYRQLKILSQREGCSLFMTLLTAFQVLLHRYTGQHDLIVGSPVSIRKRPDLEDSIGIFLNMIVLRGNLSGDPCFATLMQQTRKTCLDAFAHPDVPFEKLVEELQPPRDPSRNPLFQVMMQLSSLAELELGDLAVTSVTTDGGGSQFDLAIHFDKGPHFIRGYVEFNTDLFDDHMIERMVGHFQTLLKGIVSDPQQRISQYPMLSEAERHVFTEWNDTSVAYTNQSCLHELFLARARQTPNHIAAVYEDQQLAYSELNRRANQLGHHLQRLGVGPEVLVGICVDRSLDMLVALLGVMKAGGAYVPLDPSFPSERLAFMVEDADVAALITQPHLRDIFPRYDGSIVDIDTDWNRISTEHTHEPANAVTADDLAYVIYTSGSTGKPKGVQIGHRALVNFLSSMQKEPGLTEQDILLAVTTLSFDIAALELFLPLITGAKIALVSQQTAADGAALREELLRSRATIMQATPSTWQLMIDAGWRNPLPLKILCGGEALPRELANQLVKLGSSLWNMYGPTETTIWSSVKRIQAEAGPVLIGPPLANTTFYVLDAALQPVPVGIPGELHIGGDGLARGYLKRPSLTAEKFLNNPFDTGSTCRLYKTGDLVRYRPNGDLEFLGRLDHQIKLRGFRIELGEIEAVLNHHPTVSQAVAIVREDMPGDKRIVAYVVADAAEEVRVDNLRSFLRDKLAEYMVPSAFVQLGAFPMTPNGKVDRNALPAPAGERQTEEQFMAPRNDLEGSISKIWQELLRVNEVGIHDNFFDLGGHSLLLAHMQSRLRGITQKQLPIVEFFRYPTVAALAEFLAAGDDVQQNRMNTSDMIQNRGQRQKAALQRRRQLAGQRRRS